LPVSFDHFHTAPAAERFLKNNFRKKGHVHVIPKASIALSIRQCIDLISGPCNPVAWHSDHLRVGKRYVQMYSLKTTPEASRSCLFSGLMTLDCDSVLCSTWRPKSTAAARSEIDAQEKFISFFKVGVLTRVMSGRDTASLETGAGAKAANSSVDDLSVVIRELDKKAQGEYSLRLLLAADSAEQLRDTPPAVHRIFVDARAQVIEETLGNLCAFYAMFPGNGKFNVFPMWLGEEHHARLSSVEAVDLIGAYLPWLLAMTDSEVSGQTERLWQLATQVQQAGLLLSWVFYGVDEVATGFLLFRSGFVPPRFGCPARAVRAELLCTRVSELRRSVAGCASGPPHSDTLLAGRGAKQFMARCDGS
jgi:hypothetical protein